MLHLKIKVWDIQKGIIRETFQASDMVKALAGLNNNLIASGTRDGVVIYVNKVVDLPSFPSSFRWKA